MKFRINKSLNKMEYLSRRMVNLNEKKKKDLHFYIYSENINNCIIIFQLLMRLSNQKYIIFEFEILIIKIIFSGETQFWRKCEKAERGERVQLKNHYRP